jgi:hypothetical protein
MAGWVQRLLLCEHERAACGKAQQVCLSVMAHDHCPGTRQVGRRGAPLARRPPSDAARGAGLGPGIWAIRASMRRRQRVVACRRNQANCMTNMKMIINVII